MADGSGSILAPGVAPAEPLDVIYFAGCGGSSEAYRQALGEHPAVALNHNPVAIGVHQANFPDTEHFIADVFDVDPRCIRPGQKWRSFWASPDCRHFSKAKGGAPVSPRVRGLAWVVIKVAKLLGPLAPDVIFLENVEEFRDWGPLITDADGKARPDPDQKGRTYRLWKRRLEQCGYVVERRELIAADYGAPTTRKRLFVIARRDGKPIVWPTPTHAPRKSAATRGLKPYVPAAEVIDWSLPCPSIFLTQEECRERGIRAKRPLEEATLKRIARGVLRYVIGAAEPFIVRTDNSGSTKAGVHGIDSPVRTVTSRGGFALIQPEIVGGAIVGCGSRAGQSPPRGLDDPLGTIIGKADRCLAAAFLTKFSENSTGHLPDEPLHTVMAGAPRHGLVATFMEQANTGMVGHDAREPVSTIVGRGTTQRIVAAAMQAYYGNDQGRAVDEPLGAAVTKDRHAVLTAELEARDGAVSDRLAAFLLKFYGKADAQDLADPLHSVTARSKFGLVLVAGQVMQITDIGMRMLTPSELKAAQGFPRDYVTGWSAMSGAPVTKTQETLLIGNSVAPPVGAAIIAANLLEPQAERAAA